MSRDPSPRSVPPRGPQSQTDSPRDAHIAKRIEEVLAAPPLLHVHAGALHAWALGEDVLRYVADRVGPASRTLETGPGLSTPSFSLAEARHPGILPTRTTDHHIPAFSV